MCWTSPQIQLIRRRPPPLPPPTENAEPDHYDSNLGPPAPSTPPTNDSSEVLGDDGDDGPDGACGTLPEAMLFASTGEWVRQPGLASVWGSQALGWHPKGCFPSQCTRSVRGLQALLAELGGKRVSVLGGRTMHRAVDVLRASMGGCLGLPEGLTAACNTSECRVVEVNADCQPPHGHHADERASPPCAECRWAPVWHSHCGRASSLFFFFAPSTAVNNLLQPPSTAVGSPKPPSVTPQTASVTPQTASVTPQPPSVTLQPPSATLQPPSVTQQAAHLSQFLEPAPFTPNPVDGQSTINPPIHAQDSF